MTKKLKLQNTLAFLGIIFLTLSACNQTTTIEEPSLKLWYNEPATDWQSEALPIGNGYMGAMFFGGIEKEQIQFAQALQIDPPQA